MNQDQINELIQRHGGLVSGPVPIDPEIDNPSIAGRELKPKIPNPNPTYRYNLKNGKFFTAKDVGTDAASSFQIIDPGTAVQPLTPADRLPSAAQDLVKLDANGNVIPPNDTTTRAAKLRDPSTGAVTDLPDAKSNPEGTIKEFGDQLLNIKPDGTYTVITTKTDATGKAPTVHSGPGGSLIEYDPSKPAGQRTTVVQPGTPEKPTVSGPSDIVYQDIPDTNQQQGGRVVNGVFTPIEGLTKDKAAKATNVYGTGPNDEWRITLDDQGNEVSRVKNPNFVAPKPTQMTADTVSQNIPLLKSDGTIQWVPNQNRVPASAAMQDLLAQVGVKVNAGDLSMADAKDMLSSTVSVLNAQTAQTNAHTSQQQAATSAATTILENQRQGATTGAGLLQNRVTNAQGMLNTVLGLAGQGQRSGNMGGGLMNAPAGLGEALVGGIQGWTTELGGGQGVYDTAARMVTAADPNNGQSPEAQAAYGVLTQMLERYRGVTGQDHPAVAATTAAQASQQNGGIVAPITAPVAQSQMPNWNLVTGPQNMATTPALAPGMAGTVPPGDPRYVGTPPQTFAAPVTVPLAPYLTAQPTIPLRGGLT